MLRRKGREIDEAVARLEVQLGRQPSEEEIAGELKIDLKDFYTLLSKLDGLFLVSQQVSASFDRAETRDLIESAPSSNEDSFDICLRGETSELLAEALAKLDERSQRVLSLYYREELTMKEISLVMEIAESRVSQLHSAALLKLRTSLRKKLAPRRAIADAPTQVSEKRGGRYMGKILTQQEIDAILGSARKADKSSAPTKFIQPWNQRGSGQMHNDQARAITTLHESFARNLTHSLGAYLRIPFEVSLVSVEQLTFNEFLSAIPELTYLLALELTPPGVMAALQLDHSIVFPTVDVLLGGSGTYAEIVREISEIEEQIMEGVAKIITRELALGWAPLGFEITLGERHSTPQIQRFLPPQKKFLH